MDTSLERACAYAAQVLTQLSLKNLKSAIRGESSRITEAEWAATRVPISTNAQTKMSILSSR